MSDELKVKCWENLELEWLEEGIAVLRLNRPDALNALSSGLLKDLHSVLDEIKVDRDIRVVVLTGAGRGFCAGADLTEVAGPGVIPGTNDMGQMGFIYKFQEYLADVMLKMRELPQPIIAAVNGAAVGGGFALALASDVRVASEKAKFGSVFIKVGLSSCDVGVSYLLPRIVGASVASELMLTGRIFKADEAKQIHLVHNVVAPEELLDSALETARLIVANNEYGVWMTKKGLQSAQDAPSLRHAMEMENRTQVLGYFSGNMEEAAAAFMEGREPQWKRL